MRRSERVGLVGPALRRRPATRRARRARRRARPRRPGAATPWPMSMASRFGGRDQRLDRQRSGATDHSSSSSRASVSTGSSPTSTAPPAPSAQRPAHEATQRRAGRRASGPSASRTTHSAETRARSPRRSTSRSDQRIGCSSSSSPPSCGSKPASRAASPSCARRAALAQRGDRRVGRRGRVGRAARTAPRASAASTCSGDQGPRARDAGWRTWGEGTSRGGRRLRSQGLRAGRPRSLPLVTTRAATTGAGASRTSRLARAGARGGRRAGRAPRLRRDRAASGRCRWRRSSCRRRGCGAAAALVEGLHAATTTSACATPTARAYRDVVRGLRGRFAHAPDVVARPRDEARARARARVVRGDADAAVIPFGGGTSVVGGVEARVGDGYAGAVTLDLGAARPRARGRPGLPRGAHPGRRDRPGARGRSSRAHGLTLRYFPQSFELSTLGGWIATRAGGHFATRRHAHRRPRRVGARDHAGAACGSRGGCRAPAPARARPPAARLRGHARRDHRGVGARAAAADRSARGRACASPTSPRARRPCAAIVQAGLRPSNCRLIDAREAALTFAGDGAHGAARARLRGRGRAGRAATWRRRSRSAAGTAARGTDAGRAGRAAARPAPGARRSCARPTCATRSSRWASCQRDVRDGDHVGPLRRFVERRQGGDPRGRARRRAARRGS